MKTINTPVDRTNYEEFFLLYVDGELSPEKRAEVERFAKDHPSLSAELELLNSMVLTADEEIVFENKEELFRKEKRAVVLLFPWRTLTAAAAVLLMLAGAGWLLLRQPSGHTVNTAELAEVKTGESRSASQNPNDRATKPASSGDEHITAPDNRSNVASNAADAPESGKNVDRSKDNSSAVARNAPGTQNNVRSNRAGREIGGSANEGANGDGESAQRPEDVASKEAAEEKALRGVKISQDVASLTDQPADVEAPVSGRALPTAHIESPSNIKYVDETSSDANTIYFANASFSKRNSLRVVFRKATRIIDRITTIQ